MSKMAVHLVQLRQSAFGGQSRGSLCGRLNAASSDGMNISPLLADVTCKFCLALIARRNATLQRK